MENLAECNLYNTETIHPLRHSTLLVVGKWTRSAKENCHVTPVTTQRLWRAKALLQEQLESAKHIASIRLLPTLQPRRVSSSEEAELFAAGGEKCRDMEIREGEGKKRRDKRRGDEDRQQRTCLLIRQGSAS